VSPPKARPNVGAGPKILPHSELPDTGGPRDLYGHTVSADFAALFKSHAFLRMRDPQTAMSTLGQMRTFIAPASGPLMDGAPCLAVCSATTGPNSRIRL
jgi:hypothetical protein